MNITKNLLDMLRDRKILPADTSYTEVEINKNTVWTFTEKSNVKVWFVEHDITEAIDDFNTTNNEWYHKIFISTDKTKLKDIQVKFLKMQKNNISFSYFLKSELVFNPTKHVFSPAYELLTIEETDAFLKEINVSPKSLPLMSVDDPIAKWYGAAPGQLFKIIRKDLTGKQAIQKTMIYRLVQNVVLYKAV